MKDLELIHIIPIVIVSLAAVNHILKPLGYDLMNIFTKDENKRKMLYTVVGMCGVYIIFNIVEELSLKKDKEDFQIENCEGCDCGKNAIEKSSCIRCIAIGKNYDFEKQQCM